MAHRPHLGALVVAARMRTLLRPRHRHDGRSAQRLLGRAAGDLAPVERELDRPQRSGRSSDQVQERSRKGNGLLGQRVRQQSAQHRCRRQLRQEPEGAWARRTAPWPSCSKPPCTTPTTRVWPRSMAAWRSRTIRRSWLKSCSTRAEDPLKPDWKIISAQGAAIAKQGRHRDAIPLFERALAFSPDNPVDPEQSRHGAGHERRCGQGRGRRCARPPSCPAPRLGSARTSPSCSACKASSTKPSRSPARTCRRRRLPPASLICAIWSTSRQRRAASRVARCCSGSCAVQRLKGRRRYRRRRRPKLKGTQGATGNGDVASAGWSTEGRQHGARSAQVGLDQHT